jgi:hypothetical protein
MSEYRYTLDPKSKQHVCPNCGKRRYVYYVDLETDEYLPEQFGRCNREDKCTYHINPYSSGYAREIEKSGQISGYEPNWNTAKLTNKKPEIVKSPSYIDPSYLDKGMTEYAQNSLVVFLTSKFGSTITEKLVSAYKIGTSKKWNGATVFWQVDKFRRIRSGKIMVYNPNTGKRTDKFTSVQSLLKLTDYNNVQCLFGEHLLATSTKPIAIVESEKTAIIASAYLPQYEWLATGGKQGLAIHKFEVLAGRQVSLFPDLGAYNFWVQKQAEIQKTYPKIKFTKISTLLEEKATEYERHDGLDLADYLLRFDIADFQTKPNNLPHTTPNAKPITVIQQKVPERIKPAKIDWVNELKEIEAALEAITLPNTPVKLNKAITINNAKHFVEVNLLRARESKGNSITLTCLNHLQSLISVLKANTPPNTAS